jgi:hypothetical protein
MKGRIRAPGQDAPCAGVSSLLHDDMGMDFGRMMGETS